MTDHSYRPDLLPYAVPTRIGTPWHGWVESNLLHLDNGKTRPINYVPSGAVFWPIKAPGVAPATTPPDEVAEGREYLNYGFFHPADNRFNGTPAQIGDSNWLYPDGTATWRLSYELVRNTASFTVNVYLEGLWGFFTANNRAPTGPRRLLATLTHAPSRNGVPEDRFYPPLYGYSVPPTDPNKRRRFFGVGYPKVDGSAVLLNQMDHDLYSLDTLLASVYLINVSGTGSLQDGTAGAGITASISVYKDLVELETQGSSSGTGPIYYNPAAFWDGSQWVEFYGPLLYGPPIVSGTRAGGYSQLSKFHIWMYWFDLSGSIQSMYTLYTASGSWKQTYSVPGAPPGTFTADYEETDYSSQTIIVGSNAWTIEYTTTRTQSCTANSDSFDLGVIPAPNIANWTSSSTLTGQTFYAGNYNPVRMYTHHGILTFPVANLDTGEILAVSIYGATYTFPATETLRQDLPSVAYEPFKQRWAAASIGDFVVWI